MDYEKYLAQRTKNIEVSTIRYFFTMAKTVEDAISLALGEPDFKTPDYICKAAARSLEEGKTFYAPTTGLLELRSEISAYLERRFDTAYDPETEIIVTIGASQAIDVAIRTLVQSQDEVLIPQPSFISYAPCVEMSGGRSVFVPTYPEDNFTLRAEVLGKCITSNSKVLIMPYPNNPTGAVMTRSQLASVAEVVKKHDLIVVADEIYCELTYGRPHIAFASLPGMWERTITINGFSKSYAMTGWRLGYLAAPKPLTDQMTKIHQYNVACANTTSQYAAIDALRHGTESVDYMRSQYDEKRKFLLRGLNEMGLNCFEPRGAFYAFPSIRDTGLTSREFAERLLREAKVAVVPGNAFGETGEGFVRLAYAISVEQLEEALKRMRGFVKTVL